MNSFFRLIFILLIFSTHAKAMQVEAIYTSLCGRLVGVNLYADKRFAHFITIQGEYRKIPRYQILSMASYPLDKFPAEADLKIPATVPFTRLWTFNKGEKVIVAEGYVLGSNSSGFQVFTLNGSEVFVSRDSLWKVEVISDESSLRVQSKAKYYFSHPHQEKCKEEKVGDVLFANELISDPISIKRKFDQQMVALKILRDYEEAQAFYAIPHVYKNSTAIGYWLPSGSRYGSSEGRVSGMAPLIRNEYSKGPFSFQHLSLTGAGPIPDSIHEEPQTMVYYGFKASYLHFAAFIDPALILAGKNYQWKEEDLSGVEDRAVESSYMSLGFDRGPFSVTLFLNSHIFGGFQEENDFTKFDGNLTRVGLGWRTPKLILKFNKSLNSELSASSGSSFDWQNGNLDFMRFDAQFEWSEKIKAELFYINRVLKFQDNFSSASYDGDSKTFGVGGLYSFSRRWIVGSRFSMEKLNNKSHLKENADSFLKMAFHASMNF